MGKLNDLEIADKQLVVNIYFIYVIPYFAKSFFATEVHKASNYNDNATTDTSRLVCPQLQI